MKERQGNTKFFKYSIFTGDHIIGAKSTFFMDYPAYFKSLLKTKDIIEKFQVKTLYGAHSVSLYPKDVGLDASQKVNAYIKRRTKKDDKIEKLALKLSQNGPFDISEFYDAQNEEKMKKSKNKIKSFNKDYDDYFSRKCLQGS